MPNTGYLSIDELASVRTSWKKIQDAEGVTFIDGAAYTEGDGAANAVADFFNTAANSSDIGLARAEAMVVVYTRYGDQAASGTAINVNIHIVTEPLGTIELVAG